MPVNAACAARSAAAAQLAERGVRRQHADRVQQKTQRGQHLDRVGEGHGQGHRLAGLERGGKAAGRTLSGSAWSAMATLIVITVTLRKAGYLEGLVTPEHYQIMGKLMLAFVMLWAYFALSQFLIIWSANLPEEIPFYLRRFERSAARRVPATRRPPGSGGACRPWRTDR